MYLRPPCLDYTLGTLGCCRVQSVFRVGSERREFMHRTCQQLKPCQLFHMRTAYLTAAVYDSMFSFSSIRFLSVGTANGFGV